MIPENLRLSVLNLWDEFGKADDPRVGVVVNCLAAAAGVALWSVSTGWVSYVGVVWALLNIFPVVEWVIRG